MVEATTEAVSSSRERQSMHRLCEKIFRYTHRQQGATLQEALAAKRQTREATSYICRTLPSGLGDWKKCSEARLTSFYICTPRM